MAVKFSDFVIGTIDADLELVGFDSATPENVQVSYTDIKNDILAGAITGSGAAGQVAYFSGTSAVAGSNNLFWNNTNQTLGIGTTGPVVVSAGYSYLALNNSANGGVIEFQSNGTRIATINNNASQFDIETKIAAPITLGTNGSERARITSGGNLLVGTTTDNGNRLQVNGAGSFTNIITLNTSAADTVSLIVNGNTGSGVRQRFINQASSGFYNWQIGTSISAVNQFEILPSTAIDGTTFTTPVFKISTAGAATFSSSVTINGVLQETIVTNRQTASYTLALADRGKLVEMNVATANNLTVPLDSSVAFPVGTKIDLSQYGAGQTTVVATSGVTVRSAGGALKLAAQYSGVTLVKIATNEWYLFGDITV